jgi:hypothetical protein
MELFPEELHVDAVDALQPADQGVIGDMGGVELGIVSRGGDGGVSH